MQIFKNPIHSLKKKKFFIIILIFLTLISIYSLPVLTKNIIANTSTDKEIKNSYITTKATNNKENLRQKLNVEVILYAGQRKKLTLSECTVEEALKKANITVGNNDVINFDMSSKIFDNIKICIDKHETIDKEIIEPIPFDIVQRNVDYLNKKTTKTESLGKNGERIRKIRSELINGKIINSYEIENETTCPPEAKIILVGTHNPNIEISKKAVINNVIDINYDNKILKLKDGTELKYSRELSGQATAYTADRPGARTSTGKVAKRGMVAVDPKKISYGTKLYIQTANGSYEDYGYATADDTGGAMRAGHALVDLYMDSVSECINFGRRNVRIFVIG